MTATLAVYLSPATLSVTRRRPLTCENEKAVTAVTDRALPPSCVYAQELGVARAVTAVTTCHPVGVYATKEGKAMEQLPGFDCAICNAPIGTRNTHFLRTDRSVVCLHCMLGNALDDEITHVGTRAAIAHIINKQAK